ncbi:MAG: hypothetical protein QM763_20830 [Agriterribacter sp.]
MEVREPAIAYGKQKFTIEEYPAIEEAATEKHEYYKGEIFTISGPKVPRNKSAEEIRYIKTIDEKIALADIYNGVQLSKEWLINAGSKPLSFPYFCPNEHQ